MAEEGQSQGPSLEELAGNLDRLSGMVGQLATGHQRTLQTLEQLARGATQAAARTAPPVDPSMYDRAKEEYLKTFATDPLAVRRQENQQLATELLQVVRQETEQRLSQAEQIRRAEEMERSIYQQNPDLAHEGPYLNFYINHLHTNPQTAQWSINDKLAQAVSWARENKAERERSIIEQHERARKDIARASAPGGGAFRDPSGREVETEQSQEEANAKRFELLQGRKAAAMGGGRYAK